MTRALTASFLALSLAARLDAAALRLCVEYLPVIVYEDEAVTVSVRVEGDGAFALTAGLADAQRKTLATRTVRSRTTAESPWRGSFSLPSGKRVPAVLALYLGDRLSVRVPIFSGRQPLPPLQVKGARLCGSDGSPVLLRIEHRVFQPREDWPFVRWVGAQIYGDGWKFDRVTVVAEDLGMPKDGLLAALEAATSPKITVVPVPSDTRDVALPVLRAVAALSNARSLGTPDLAVLFLGHGDVDFGTDVAAYGRALELILQQFEVRGCDQFAMAPPVGPPHLQKRLAPYAREARRVARIYHARVLPVGAALRDAHWTAGGATAPVTRRWPDAAGHAALAKAILEGLAGIRQ